MPTVQRYGPRKVDIAAYPGVRKQAAETAYSEGYAVDEAQARQGETLGQLGGQAFHLGASEAVQAAKAEKDRANQVAYLNAVTRTGRWKNQRVLDPDTGALTVKGKDAFGLPEQISQEYEQVTGEIAASLTNDEQRFAYQKYVAEDGLALDHQIRQHTYTEIQRYEGQELNAFLDNSRNQTILQAGVPQPPGAEATLPRQVATQLAAQEQAIRTHGPRLGLGPEQMQQAIDKTRSETHVGVVSNLLATQQTKTAQAYFDATSDQIDAAQRPRLAAALKEGHVRKDAQQQADAILAAGGTLTEQRTKAKAIEDPDVRDQALQYLEHEATIKERADREATDAAVTGAANILEQTPNIHKIPETTWVSFDLDTRNKLERYADYLAAGKPPTQTDFPTYFRLESLAQDDPEEFLKQTANLPLYGDRISEGDLKQLTALRGAIKNGNKEAAAKTLGPARLQEAVIDDSLTLYGIDPKTKDTKQLGAIAELRGMLRQRVEWQESHTQKPVTDVELRGMVDQILATPVNVPGSWWGLWPWSNSSLKETTGKVFDVTIDQIPAGERARIEANLRAFGEPVSDARILSLYRDYLARQNAQSLESRKAGGPRIGPAKPGTALPTTP